MRVGVDQLGDEMVRRWPEMVRRGPGKKGDTEKNISFFCVCVCTTTQKASEDGQQACAVTSRSASTTHGMFDAVRALLQRVRVA